MKKIFYLTLALTLALTACKKDKEEEDSEIIIPSGDGLIANAVKDVDGNTYNAVKLGKQIWMSQNLRTKRYSDGTTIPNVRYPNNSDLTMGTFGLLYDWVATVDGYVGSNHNPSGIQGVCPKGWHVPSDSEWTELTDYLKNKSLYLCNDNVLNIAKALASQNGWSEYSYNECAVTHHTTNNNTSGFNAMPAGSYYNNTPEGFGREAIFWSSYENASDKAIVRTIISDNATVIRDNKYKSRYNSVRCIMD